MLLSFKEFNLFSNLVVGVLDNIHLHRHECLGHWGVVSGGKRVEISALPGGQR